MHKVGAASVKLLQAPKLEAAVVAGVRYVYLYLQIYFCLEITGI